MYGLDLSSSSKCCSIKPSYFETPARQNWDHAKSALSQEPEKFWSVSTHCSSLLFPSPFPDIEFDSCGCNFNFLLHSYNSRPGQDLVSVVRQAHYRVIFKLNQSQLQVKYFILPVKLMKLKYIDPYSRQRIVEEICKYLSSQRQLKGVVLEQASVTLADLCRLLLAVSSNSRVKRLYLWDVIDKCQLPFRGPLKSDTNLDDQPRIPYTYNPGGRKYLKELELRKKTKELNESTLSETNGSIQPPWEQDVGFSMMTEFERSFMEHLLLSAQPSEMSIGTSSAKENYNMLLNVLYEPNDVRRSLDTVKTHFDVGTQYNILSDSKISSKHCLKTIDSKKNISALLTETKSVICKQYLKVHENSELGIKILREIYMVALNGLANLTTLSINYGLLADGSGEVLFSIGSVMNRRLKELELLCREEELPSPPHQRFQQSALQTIPDLAWQRIKSHCRDLRVDIVCVADYDVTMRFVTRSIPLRSLHLLYNFSPTLVTPQLTFFSTLKFLSLNFQETLDHINIIFWHSSGRIDSALEKFIKDSSHLRCFEYSGPLYDKATISKLCDAALHPNSELLRFKLQIQGDPCFPHIVKKLIDDLYYKYQPKFDDRSVEFVLKTHDL